MDISWYSHWFKFEHDSLESTILNVDRGKCDLIYRFLNTPRFAKLFVEKINDVMEILYKDDRIYKIIDEEFKKIEKSQEFYLHNSEDLRKNVSTIKERVSERRSTIMYVIDKYYSDL